MFDKLIILAVILPLSVFSHGGDDGPSALEEEFSMMSHIHLPVNFNTLEGLSFGYPFGGDHGHEEIDHDDHDDHGDMHTDDHSDDIDEADSHTEENGFELDVHPVVFAGYDRINRYLNLEKAANDTTGLDLSDNNDHYLHVQSRKWNFGYGVEADMHLPLPLWSFAFGVSKIKSKNYISKMILESRTEQRLAIKSPLNMSELSNWRTGDSMSYMTSGSMVFAAMVGIEPFFHIGPEYIHSGNYKINLELKDLNTLVVNIITTKTNSIGIEGNAIISGIEASTGHSKMRNIIYEFDVSNEESLKALGYLLNGRIDLTNKELLTSNGSIVLKSRFNNKYRSITGSFGIPVLYFRGKNRGIYNQEGIVENFEHGDIEQVFSSTTVKEKFSRGLWSRHLWHTESITSSIIRHDDHEDESILSTQFNYSFSNDNMRYGEFAKSYKKLVKRFKLDTKKLNLPYKRNGFIKIDLSLNLNAADILTLLDGSKLKNILHSSKARHLKKLLKLKVKIDKDYKASSYASITKSLTKFMRFIFQNDRLLEKFLNQKRSLPLKLSISGDYIRQHNYLCQTSCILQ